MKVSEAWRENQSLQQRLSRLEGEDVLGKTSHEKKLVSRAQMQKDGMRAKRFKAAHSDYAWNMWVWTIGTGTWPPLSRTLLLHHCSKIFHRSCSYCALEIALQPFVGLPETA